MDNWRITESADAILYPYEAIPTITGMADGILRYYRASLDTSLLKLGLDKVKLAVNLIPIIHERQKSDLSKIKLSQELYPLVETGISLAIASYQLYEDTDYLWDALVFAEQIRSRVLLEELVETQAILFSDLPREIQKDILQFDTQAGFFKRLIAKEEAKEHVDSIELIKLKKELFLLEEQKELIDKDLRKNYPAYQQIKSATFQLDKETLKQHLSDLHLIEYFWGPQYIYVFHIEGGNISIRKLEDPEEIQSLVDEMSNLLRTPDMGQSSFDSFTSASYELYSHLLRPSLENHTMEPLVIIPDGPLNFIPFEILLTDSIKTISSQNAQSISSGSFRYLPYLFQKRPIRYSPSASQIIWQANEHLLAHKQLGAFAPEYGSLLDLKLNRLSAQEISELTQGEMFIDENASEEQFKLYADRFQALHLAVHGFADSEIPLNAYLQFGENLDSLEDGKLFVYELYALKLKAKLVSLMACEAGYGKLEKGEGVMSLARAFRFAGTNTIMTSLWKADANAARPVSKYFYEELLNGKRPSVSLNQARKRFLQEAPPDLIHPYYWSTYVLMGADDAIWESGNNYLFILTLALLALIVLAILRNKK